MFHKALTQLAVFLPFCCTALAATSLGSLTDSAGQPLVQASSCTLSPCLQGVAYGAGYLAGCQVNLLRYLHAAARVHPSQLLCVAFVLFRNLLIFVLYVPRLNPK